MYCQKLLSLAQNVVMLIFYQSFVMLLIILLYLYCCCIKGLYLNLNVKYLDGYKYINNNNRAFKVK